jgi:hypothetical protein
MNYGTERNYAPTSTASLSLKPPANYSNSAVQFEEPDRQGSIMSRSGILILNADDWGRDRNTSDRILECILRGTVSSTSAMVFMEDSERAAAMAQEKGVDAGLHLNLTTPFSASSSPAKLLEHQKKVSRYLNRYPLTQVVFHPGLVNSFEYVVTAQLDEFRRIYNSAPRRLDGHHHMHLSANVLLQRLLPAGTIVRRNFSFQSGEKNFWNRLYRKGVDGMLARRHRLVDFFFSLPPLEPQRRLERILAVARQSVVEVETHPVNQDEFRFLMGDGIVRWTGSVPVASRFAMAGFVVPENGTHA